MSNTQITTTLEKNAHRECELVKTCSHDDLLSVLDRLDAFKKQTKLVASMIEEAVLERLKTDPDLKDGLTDPMGGRYYPGYNSRVKCNNVRGVVEQILEATGGDLDKITDCLGSDPFKQGTVKEVVGEETHGVLFTKEKTPVIKEGKGKPKKTLQHIPAFIARSKQ